MGQEPLGVLLVEDDEVDIMNVRRAFKRKQLPHPLAIAQDGLEALSLLRSGIQDDSSVLPERCIVLLDLNLPRMSGLEFLTVVRRDPDLQSLPVVVLTTSDDETDRRQAYRLNVAGYILKSGDFQQFADRIEALTHYWSLCKMP